MGSRVLLGGHFHRRLYEKEEFYSSLKYCCKIRDIENKGTFCPDCGSNIRRIG